MAENKNAEKVEGSPVVKSSRYLCSKCSEESGEDKFHIRSSGVGRVHEPYEVLAELGVDTSGATVEEVPEVENDEIKTVHFTKKDGMSETEGVDPWDKKGEAIAGFDKPLETDVELTSSGDEFLIEGSIDVIEVIEEPAQILELPKFPESLNDPKALRQFVLDYKQLVTSDAPKFPENLNDPKAIRQFELDYKQWSERVNA